MRREAILSLCSAEHQGRNMTDDGRAREIASLYEAWGRGQMDVVREGLAEDLVWHAAGQGPLSGDYRGQDDFFNRLAARVQTADRWDVLVQTVLVNGSHALVPVRIHGRRGGRDIETDGAHVLRIDGDGRGAEVWAFVHDQQALDDF